MLVLFSCISTSNNLGPKVAVEPNKSIQMANEPMRTHDGTIMHVHTNQGYIRLLVDEPEPKKTEQVLVNTKTLEVHRLPTDTASGGDKP